jgi:hypothetical protein
MRAQDAKETTPYVTIVRGTSAQGTQYAPVACATLKYAISVSPTGSNEDALENVGDAYDRSGIVVSIHDTRLACTVTIGFDENKLSTESREKKLRLLALLVPSTLLTTHSGRPTIGLFRMAFEN